MKNALLLFFLLITLSCLAQKSDRQFTVAQIDSIVIADNNRYLMTDSAINVEISNIDGTKISGKGGSSISSYIWHFDKANYNKLSQKEKLKLSPYKKSRLIRAKYHETIHFSDDYSVVTSATFYYTNCNTLFFVTITKTVSYNDKEVTSHTFEINNPENESIHGKEFISEFEDWIQEKNEKIVQQHFELYQCK